uniref:Secreted protein n=2 Tax=Oryza TaxID=4527 RepID=Q6Z7W4_ORYSJ|nr:hypothetical protein [Oryza sativa Japonica Group]
MARVSRGGLYFSWALAVVTGELCANSTTNLLVRVTTAVRYIKAVVIHPKSPTFKTGMALAHATCHPNVRVPLLSALHSASCFKPPREANLLLPTPAVPTLPIPPAIPKLPMPLRRIHHAIEPLIYSIRGASLRGRMVRCPLSNSWEQAGHAKPAGQ